jgi:hypothetical protein
MPILMVLGVCAFFLFPAQRAPRDACAQDVSQGFQLRCRNGRVMLRAEEAELRELLLDLGDQVNIPIQVPLSLEKRITLDVADVSIHRAFRILLKDLNHAIVYANRKRATGIDRVFVFSKGKRAVPSKRVTGRAAGRIRNVQRQLDALRNRMSHVGEDSRQGRFLQSRIGRMEKTLERLQGKGN